MVCLCRRAMHNALGDPWFEKRWYNALVFKAASDAHCSDQGYREILRYYNTVAPRDFVQVAMSKFAPTFFK